MFTLLSIRLLVVIERVRVCFDSRVDIKLTVFLSLGDIVKCVKFDASCRAMELFLG